MARGITPAAVVRRQETSERLFAQLSRTTCPAQRRQLIDDIVLAYLPLCDGLAGRYLGRGAEADDLLQVARTGLLMAVRRFRPDRGVGFLSFAVPTITGELKRHFRDHCWVIRPPRKLQELRARAMTARSVLQNRLGRSVSCAELAVSLQVERADVEESLASASGFRPISLDGRLPSEAVDNLGALLSGEDDLATACTERIAVERLLAQLPARDQLIIAWRFGEECTQREIGERLGVSQMQVSRSLVRILQRARAILGEREAAAG